MMRNDLNQYVLGVLSQRNIIGGRRKRIRIKKTPLKKQTSASGNI
jgi:hypothetical protein